MSFTFRNLDQATRERMLLELEEDLGAGRLYVGSRLSPSGATVYPELLRAAFSSGDCESLVASLRAPGVLNGYEFARNPRGGPDIRKTVPRTAADTMAEGEFNRFYARGLCRLVLETEEGGSVLVYRARPSLRPRPDSELLLGARILARKLLDDLREHIGVDTALGLPAGPNSGISVCLE